MNVVAAGAVRLVCQQLGEGPDVVLVHGLATNRAFWYASLAQSLRTRYRVTLYDLRGHGYSDRPERGYRAQDQAQDLAAVIEAEARTPVHLVAHSFGGSIALEYALAHPQNVASLSLLDTRVQALQPEQWLRDSPHLSDFEKEMAAADGRDWNAEPQIGLAFLEAMARLRAGGYQPSARDTFTPFAEGRGGRRTPKAFCRLLDETEARADFLAASSPASAIAGLDMPVQLLYGARSRNLPSGKALADCLPRARLHTLPEAGHFFPLSNAGVTAERVRSFLDDVEAGRMRVPDAGVAR